jgi:hypothetical protein
MQASPARGAKRRAKALKPANPWLALPKLAALFEPLTPQNFFKGSKVPELEELALSETQLLEQTAALLGVSLAQLVRAGAPKPPATEAAAPKRDTAPAKEGPQTTTAKPAGETQTTKTKRAAPKAKPLPKKLRNPKNHPDLIADDAHVKTAQKKPEAAQRDHHPQKAQKPAKRLRNPENEPF